MRISGWSSDVCSSDLAFSFGSALAGFCVLMSRRPGADLLSETPSRPMSRTAILVPVYNEDVDAVFRRVRVMADSLQSVTMAGAFDIFILSDSTDPEIHDAERLAFERLPEIGRASCRERLCQYV